MSTTKRTLTAAAALALLLAPSAARADSWPSGQPGAPPSAGVVPEYLDGNGNAQPNTAFAPIYAASAGASVTVTPTVSTSAYTSGMCLGSSTGASGGTAVQTLNLAAPTHGVPIGVNGNGYLDGATVTDRTHQDAVIYTWVFNVQPTGTYNDHAACTLATGDVPVAVLAWSSYQLDGSGTEGVAEALRQNGNALFDHFNLGAGNKSLYLVSYTTGTPTYASGTALAMKYTVSY